MLILTRKPGETLRIGEDISIHVLGVKGNQVRIGVEAPRDLAVHREEIYDRIKEQNDRDGGEVRTEDPCKATQKNKTAGTKERA